MISEILSKIDEAQAKTLLERLWIAAKNLDEYIVENPITIIDIPNKIYEPFEAIIREIHDDNRP